MEAMLSGSPLLFLDLRDRTMLGNVPDRATLLARAKEEYAKHCDAMLEQKVAECLDACSIAYFHEVRSRTCAVESRAGRGATERRPQTRLRMLGTEFGSRVSYLSSSL